MTNMLVKIKKAANGNYNAICLYANDRNDSFVELTVANEKVCLSAEYFARKCCIPNYEEEHFMMYEYEANRIAPAKNLSFRHRAFYGCLDVTEDVIRNLISCVLQGFDNQDIEGYFAIEINGVLECEVETKHWKRINEEDRMKTWDLQF